MKKNKRRSPWIAIALLITLTGCGTGNALRRVMNVEPQPKKIDIEGVFIATRILPQVTNQHPPTQALYVGSDGDLGCVQFPGRDLGKADKKAEPFGSFQAQRRWNKETSFGLSCPEVVSWDGWPKKTASRTRLIDPEIFRSFLWAQVGKSLQFLAPVEGRVLFRLFWPNEIPPELLEVWKSLRPRPPPSGGPVGSIMPRRELPPGGLIEEEEVNMEIEVNGER